MIRIFLLVVALVVATSLLLHVSAGWAWLIVLTAIAAFIVWVRRQPKRGRWVTLSAIWKCPYCLTAKPLGATVCRHCGMALIVPADDAGHSDELDPIAADERWLIGSLADTVDTLTRSLGHVGRSLRLIAEPEENEPPPPPLELLPQPSTEEDPSTHDPPPP